MFLKIMFIFEEMFWTKLMHFLRMYFLFTVYKIFFATFLFKMLWLTYSSSLVSL